MVTGHTFVSFYFLIYGVHVRKILMLKRLSWDFDWFIRFEPPPSTVKESVWYAICLCLYLCKNVSRISAWMVGWILLIWWSKVYVSLVGVWWLWTFQLQKQSTFRWTPKQNQPACFCWLLIGLPFDPEYEGSLFLWKVGLSLKYMVLQPRKLYSAYDNCIIAHAVTSNFYK